MSHKKYIKLQTQRDCITLSSKDAEFKKRKTKIKTLCNEMRAQNIYHRQIRNEANIS